MKIFLQPFDAVITVVFVVTVDEAVLITWVDCLEVVFVISNTFFGARSNGLKTVLVPVSGSFSIIKPSCATFSSLLSERLLLLMLDAEVDLVGCVELEDISDATKAALTSGERLLHASNIEAGNKGEGKVEASSLEKLIDHSEVRKKGQINTGI